MIRPPSMLILMLEIPHPLYIYKLRKDGQLLHPNKSITWQIIRGLCRGDLRHEEGRKENIGDANEKEKKSRLKNIREHKAYRVRSERRKNHSRKK